MERCVRDAPCQQALNGHTRSGSRTPTALGALARRSAAQERCKHQPGWGGCSHISTTHLRGFPRDTSRMHCRGHSAEPPTRSRGRPRVSTHHVCHFARISGRSARRRHADWHGAALTSPTHRRDERCCARQRASRTCAAQAGGRHSQPNVAAHTQTASRSTPRRVLRGGQLRQRRSPHVASVRAATAAQRRDLREEGATQAPCIAMRQRAAGAVRPISPPGRQASTRCAARAMHSRSARTAHPTAPLSACRTCAPPDNKSREALHSSSPRASANGARGSARRARARFGNEERGDVA